MSAGPQVTVLVPCHNAARTLPLQLAALAAQQQAGDFEVLVIDNRSTDASARVVADWQARLPGLRRIPATVHAGAGYARNVGARLAAGSKLLCCDADDVVARDWVARAAEALDEVELACGSDITLRDGEFSSLQHVWRDHLDGMPTSSVQRRTAPAAYPILLGGNLAVRADTFRRIGGFDISMRLANEDNDLAVRAQHAGLLVHRAPAMRIAIRERADLRSRFRRARTAGQGHMQLCRRHDLQSVSPYLSDGRWRTGAIRGVAAAAVMLGRPVHRDWDAVATRTGAGIGFWEGDLRGRLGRFPEPRIGVGLWSDTEDRDHHADHSDNPQEDRP